LNEERRKRIPAEAIMANQAEEKQRWNQGAVQEMKKQNV
jgi:hypothetical protein